jgi:hypothetical protein
MPQHTRGDVINGTQYIRAKYQSITLYFIVWHPKEVLQPRPIGLNKRYNKNRNKISFCACAIDDRLHQELDRRRMQLKHWYHHPYTSPNLPQLNNIAGKGEYSRVLSKWGKNDM